MPRQLLRSTKTCLLLSLMLFVSGCANLLATDTCTWVKVVTVSSQDTLTDQTAREILAHNEKVEEICGR